MPRGEKESICRNVFSTLVTKWSRSETSWMNCHWAKRSLDEISLKLNFCRPKICAVKFCSKDYKLRGRIVNGAKDLGSNVILYIEDGAKWSWTYLHGIIWPFTLVKYSSAKIMARKVPKEMTADNRLIAKCTWDIELWSVLLTLWTGEPVIK